MTVAELAHALAAPFAAEAIQWRIITAAGRRALVAPYIDARAVQQRLDDVLGLDGWQDRYERLADGSMLCSLQVRIPGTTEWITRSDAGTAPPRPRRSILSRLLSDRHHQEQTKAACSDALKRAAVKFGVARYLYSAVQVWVAYEPARRQLLETPAAVALRGVPGPSSESARATVSGEQQP